MKTLHQLENLIITEGKAHIGKHFSEVASETGFLTTASRYHPKKKDSTNWNRRALAVYAKAVLALDGGKDMVMSEKDQHWCDVLAFNSPPPMVNVLPLAKAKIPLKAEDKGNWADSLRTAVSYVAPFAIPAWRKFGNWKGQIFLILAFKSQACQDRVTTHRFARPAHYVFPSFEVLR